KAERVVRELFQIFMDEPHCLPSRWQGAIDGDRHQRARLAADYIAGMTDRYALLEHQRLFDPTVKS
ncbi:MAG: deoxyguanosinetriphosphate triphosphohydrolase, partial [Thalassobaculaceae bacterium]